MARLLVRVTARGGRNAIEGRDRQGVVHLRVTAPPAGGAANEAAGKLIADLLRLPKRAVVLESGHRSRLKRFAVPLGVEELKARLAGLPLLDREGPSPPRPRP